MYKHLKEEGFQNFVVYNDGKVKNTKTGKFIKGDVNNCGYARVTLYSKPYKKRFFTHRLVAKYFVEGYDDSLQVNHIDGNKLNNNYKNLEWVTQSKNEQHKQKFLNPKVTNKEVVQVLEDGKELCFYRVKDCALYNKVSRNTISKMLTGKVKNKLNVRYKNCGINAERLPVMNVAGE